MTDTPPRRRLPPLDRRSDRRRACRRAALSPVAEVGEELVTL
jgi:hypothetical protein